MADNKQCKCTNPQYTIKLNGQGAQGPAGPQGEQGFSPTLSVNTQTDTEYKLLITNENGSYVTPNLIGPQGPKGEKGDAGDIQLDNSTLISEEGILKVNPKIATINGDITMVGSLANNVRLIAKERPDVITIDSTEKLAYLSDIDDKIGSNGGTINGTLTLNGSLNIKPSTLRSSQTYLGFYDPSLVYHKLANNADLDNEISIREQRDTALEGLITDETEARVNDISSLQTSKQDKLVAGTNITIVGNTISATGGAEVDIATVNKAGIVKPDGETILITPDGTITAVGGGGEGGTTDYNLLDNKPSINGVELTGNKTITDFLSIGDGLLLEEILKFNGVNTDVATVNGALYINNSGIATNFNYDNYISLPTTSEYIAENVYYEITFKLDTLSPSIHQSIWSSDTIGLLEYYDGYIMGWNNQTNSAVRIYSKSNLTAGEYYTIRYHREGNIRYYEIKPQDGEYTLAASFTDNKISTNPKASYLGAHYLGSYGYLGQGAIDITKSNIQIGTNPKIQLANFTTSYKLSVNIDGGNA